MKKIHLLLPLSVLLIGLSGCVHNPDAENTPNNTSSSIGNVLDIKSDCPEYTKLHSKPDLTETQYVMKTIIIQGSDGEADVESVYGTVTTGTETIMEGCIDSAGKIKLRTVKIIYNPEKARADRFK